MPEATEQTETGTALAFFDECGDHPQEKVDRDFPPFSLALVVVESAACPTRALPELNHFKLRCFNHEGINFQSRYLRLASGAFTPLLNGDRRPAPDTSSTLRARTGRSRLPSATFTAVAK